LEDVSIDGRIVSKYIGLKELEREIVTQNRVQWGSGVTS
jgi:hypothetical protein